MHAFRFDRAKAARSLEDPDGAPWAVNAFSDADELNTLLEAALACGAIASPRPRARLYVYPLSTAEPEPLLAVDPGGGPTLLGYALGLCEREGEGPVEFTLRFLEEVTAQANALAEADRPRRADEEREEGMTLLCPRCCSEEAALADRRGARLECGNCGAGFHREEALVSVADAEAHAERRAACSCDELRGCPQCFERAGRLVGARVRDSQGREWEVTEAGEKDGFPTVGGGRFWERLDQVEVLREAA
jgi:hypothetical protein